jgi:hypothetical protein
MDLNIWSDMAPLSSLLPLTPFHEIPPVAWSYQSAPFGFSPVITTSYVTLENDYNGDSWSYVRLQTAATSWLTETSHGRLQSSALMIHHALGGNQSDLSLLKPWLGRLLGCIPPALISEHAIAPLEPFHEALFKAFVFSVANKMIDMEPSFLMRSLTLLENFTTRMVTRPRLSCILH